MAAQAVDLRLVETVQAIVHCPMPVVTLDGTHATVGVPERLMRDLHEAYKAWLEEHKAKY